MSLRVVRLPQSVAKTNFRSIQGLILVIILFITVITNGSAIPPIPSEYYGTVVIDGAPAPAGTVITATVDGMPRGTITVTSPGIYGGPGNFNSRLVVTGKDTEVNYNIRFSINGIMAQQSPVFSGGTSERLDLIFSSLSGDQYTISGSDSDGVGPSHGVEEDQIIESEKISEAVQQSSVTTTLGELGVQTTQSASGETQFSLDTNVLENAGNQISVLDNTVTIQAERFTLSLMAKDINIDQQGIVSGSLESIQLETVPNSLTVTGVGQVSAMLDLALTGIPEHTSITTTVTSDLPSEVQSAFQLAATQEGKEIDSVAYSMIVERSNLENTKDILEATIRMTCPVDWVATHGGKGAIAIVHQGDTGAPEFLDTHLVGTDKNGNFIFEAISPRGLSRFALVAVHQNPVSGNNKNPESQPSSLITKITSSIQTTEKPYDTQPLFSPFLVLIILIIVVFPSAVILWGKRSAIKLNLFNNSESPIFIKSEKSMQKDTIDPAKKIMLLQSEVAVKNQKISDIEKILEDKEREIQWLREQICNLHNRFLPEITDKQGKDKER